MATGDTTTSPSQAQAQRRLHHVLRVNDHDEEDADGNGEKWQTTYSDGELFVGRSSLGMSDI
jgi:hypothetical protein